MLATPNEFEAVEITLDDAMIENVIVFSGKVGVNSTNPANRIQGVHTWNLVGSQGGYGIVLNQGGGRVPPLAGDVKVPCASGELPNPSMCYKALRLTVSKAL